ncbi:MAG: endo alpha-1,4 polygalactosaminidase [Methylococcales bacterium]|nr:endo alpha-1,4 polygalactosaminidase [Methylococcales bacterium]
MGRSTDGSIKGILIIFLCGLTAAFLWLSLPRNLLPSTLFYYGKDIPIDHAAKFQQLIVEPANFSKKEIESLKNKGVRVYAYLSIGEIGQFRSWRDQVDSRWVLGENKNWQSKVMDMTNLDWHTFLIQQQAMRLWQQGYDGFFLDTIDSHKLIVNKPNELLDQHRGTVALIKKIHRTFSGVHLLLNRGFDLLDEVADLADGVVAESLFVGWDSVSSQYIDVATIDHQWLLKKLTYIKERYQLPIIVVDYLPMGQKERSQQVAKKILALGFVPWVSTMALNQMGVGIANLSTE